MERPGQLRDGGGSHRDVRRRFRQPAKHRSSFGVGQGQLDAAVCDSLGPERRQVLRTCKRRCEAILRCLPRGQHGLGVRQVGTLSAGGLGTVQPLAHEVLHDNRQGESLWRRLRGHPVADPPARLVHAEVVRAARQTPAAGIKVTQERRRLTPQRYRAALTPRTRCTAPREPAVPQGGRKQASNRGRPGRSRCRAPPGPARPSGGSGPAGQAQPRAAQGRSTRAASRNIAAAVRGSFFWNSTSSARRNASLDSCGGSSNCG